MGRGVGHDLFDRHKKRILFLDETTRQRKNVLVKGLIAYLSKVCLGRETVAIWTATRRVGWVTHRRCRCCLCIVPSRHRASGYRVWCRWVMRCVAWLWSICVEALGRDELGVWYGSRVGSADRRGERCVRCNECWCLGVMDVGCRLVSCVRWFHLKGAGVVRGGGERGWQGIRGKRE